MSISTRFRMVWKWIWSKSIARQLVIGVASVHMLLMTIFVYDLVERQKSFLTERMERRTLNQTELLAANVLHAVLARDLAGLSEIIASFSKDKLVLYAMVTDENGLVLGHSKSDERGKYTVDALSQQVLASAPNTHLTFKGQDSFEAASPIMISGRVIGWARTASDLTANQIHLQYVTYAGLAYTLFAILIGTIFAILLARSMTRQLRLLVSGTKRISSGNLSEPIPITTENEVGTLANAFNSAMNDLANKQEALEKSLTTAADALTREQTASKQRDRAKDEIARSLEREKMAREEAERQFNDAQHANRLKDEFLANVSHELRTPLNVMLGYSDLLRSNGLAEADIIPAIQAIYRNARTQAQIIDDLLDVSRIISGKLQLQTNPVDLQTVIHDGIEAVRLSADAKKIDVSLTIDPSVGPVAGDAGRLQQIVWNLLSNAIKFTPRGGKVEVSVLRKHSNAVIEVKDNGEGIDPTFLPFVFDRFRQEDSSKTRRFGGLGLGLSIVRHLTEAHGGTATVESEGKGNGSTFSISLPVLAVRLSSHESLDYSSNMAVNTSNSSENAQCLAGVRILLVDDVEDIRKLIGKILKKYGAEICFASSCQEALEKLGSFRPDVLLSDIGMPNEDGYELIRRIRASTDHRRSLIPAAALTAHARDEEKKLALAAGFQLHISKPVETQHLIQAVRSLIKDHMAPV